MIGKGFPDDSDGKESACNAGDLGSTPGLGKSPGEGNSNPLQDSCLKNPMHRGAWRAIVHGVVKSRTRLCDSRTRTHTHILDFKLFCSQSLETRLSLPWDSLVAQQKGFRPLVPTGGSSAHCKGTDVTLCGAGVKPSLKY